MAVAEGEYVSHLFLKATKAKPKLINHDSIRGNTTDTAQYLPDRRPRFDAVTKTLPYPRALAVRQNTYYCDAVMLMISTDTGSYGLSLAPRSRT
jgi:hypothetical protein